MNIPLSEIVNTQNSTSFPKREEEKLIPTQLLNITKELRVDKNFGYNILDFKNQPQEMQNVLKSLIVYMSLKHQKDLFGCIEFDPYDFEKVMGLPWASMSKKAQDPIWYKLNNKGKSKEELQELERIHGNLSEYRCWDSVLENAFLILQNTAVHKTYKRKINDNIQTLGVDVFRYIENFEIVIKKIGRTRKIFYRYKLTEPFEKSLQSFYCLINIETFNKLRPNNLEDCYIKLIEIIQDFNLKCKNSIKYNLEKIADLLNIERGNSETIPEEKFSDIKKKVNNKLKKFIELIEKDFNNLTYYWEKSENSRYKNNVVFTWEQKYINPIDKTAEDRRIYDDLLYTEMIKKLTFYFIYSVQYTDNENKKHSMLELEYNEEMQKNWFLRWIIYDKNSERIQNSYFQSTYGELFGQDSLIQKATSEKYFQYIIALTSYSYMYTETKIRARNLFYENGFYKIINVKTNQIFKTENLKDFIIYLVKNYRTYSALKDYKVFK